MLPLNLLQIEVSIVNHICKVDLIMLLELLLIVLINLLGDVQEQ